MVILHLVLACIFARQVNAYAVFAHFMVTNSANYTLDTWEDDMRRAQEVSIDAFALNMAYGDPTNDIALPMAFEAASKVSGFSLFFSFDYAGNGPWPKNIVNNLILKYSGYSSYYRYNSKPFVSTFEGPGNGKDWISIKASTGCFFVPDWSSLGAKAALEAGGGGIADGLFNWAAWPYGHQDMDTYTDASYLQYINQTGTALPYMMPISPWFYTNLPGYNKNWLWRGDHLWHDRWLEAWFLRPEFVQILTWNDYGESHYIGPIRDNAMEAFHIGRAPFNYVTDMPHDGWRLLVRYVAEVYKHGFSPITKETLVIWYRLQPASACGSGGTSANTASQLQIEYSPEEVMQDMVFFSVLLEKAADVSVTIGGAQVKASWRNVPDPNSGIYHATGIYHGQASFSGHTGDVVVTISRNGKTIAEVKGKAITISCTNGLANWNAWVGSAQASADVNALMPEGLGNMVCTNGTGANNFAGICDFSCKHGYCPVSACICRDMGVPMKKPNATGIQGYPKEGLDASYSGVCSFDCNYGYCPDNACGLVDAPLVIPTVSDFAPPACVAGTGDGNLAGLCSFSCNFGFCPRNACTCTKQGALTFKNPTSSIEGKASNTADEAVYGPLCSYACQRGYCPEGVCTSAVTAPKPTDSHGSIIAIDQSIWDEDSPAVTCTPPCDMIMPPKPLNTHTTITFPSSTTEFTYRSKATSTTTLNNGEVTEYASFAIYYFPTVIPIKPLTTGQIPVWHQQISVGQQQVYQTSSIEPPWFNITWIPTIGGTTSINGATTTTIPGTTWSTGSHTYIRQETTMTVGGTTNVKDGTTLPPRTSRITPNVYPTTTNTPDPELNNRPTKVSTSGSSGPSCTANCFGGCTSHCFGGCPICPPGFGGSLGGGSGSGSSGGSNNDGDDDDDDDDDNKKKPRVTAAGAAGSIWIEAFPTGKPSREEMNSVGAAVGSRLSSLYASEQAVLTGGAKPTPSPSRMVMFVEHSIVDPNEDDINQVFDFATTSTTLNQAFCTGKPLVASTNPGHRPPWFDNLSLGSYTACGYHTAPLGSIGSLVCENGYTAHCGTVSGLGNVDCTATKTYHTVLAPQVTCVYG